MLFRSYYVAGPPIPNERCTSLFRAPVSEMTYTVSSGTLNPTTSYRNTAVLINNRHHNNVSTQQTLQLHSNEIPSFLALSTGHDHSLGKTCSLWFCRQHLGKLEKNNTGTIFTPHSLQMSKEINTNSINK